MTVYNSLTSRADVDVLVPDPISAEIFQGAVDNSFIMRKARRLPNMAAYTERLPVLDALPIAYFVNEAAPKQTTEVNWTNVVLTAAEIAVIQPIPEQVLDDSSFDVWGQVKPLIAAALGKTFDAAVAHGTNKPAAWPSDLVTQATAAGNTVKAGSNDDLYDDILGQGGLFSTVEADGYMVDGSVAAISFMSMLRGTRGSDGEPLFLSEAQSAQNQPGYFVGGVPTDFPRNGALDPTAALMLAGDWSQLVYSIRQDITYKVLTEATITDNASPRAIIYSLGQDDMVALRVTMRLAWQLPNPINVIQPTKASRCPFAVLTPAS